MLVSCAFKHFPFEPGNTSSRGSNGSHLPPPHRSVRAELPHMAPALHFNAEAGYGMKMHR